MTSWILTLGACGWFAPDLDFLDAPAPPGEVGPRDLALARTGDATLQLPPMNRPDSVAAPDVFELVGEFEERKTVEGVTIYAVPLPVPVHLLPNPSSGSHLIGGAEPAGFVVTGPDGPLRWHFPRARAPYSWGFDEKRLFVGLPEEDPAPRAADYRVAFPRATAAENRRNYAVSGLTPDAFVRREVTVGKTSRHGLFLPAPGRATFPITVPDAARLTLTATILPPAILHAIESDGARLEVRVEQGGAVTDLGSLDLSVGEVEPGDFDLSAFAGQAVDLVIETVPGASRDFDYVFLAAPVVGSRTRRPQRVLAVFVDTLRPDHLGFMGYERDTSPTLDRLAKHATVFTNARSVAPWTLPSARAALSGHQPERWFEVTTLAEKLGAMGFRTEGLVTNAFLSAPFDVQRGFDRYRYRHLLPAHEVVAEVEDVVERWPNRDLFVLAHFMEPHLPYQEPWSQRFRWAGLRPGGIHSFVRNALITVDEGQEDFEAIRQHVVDRYDQNIAAFDRAIGRALAAMGPDATVVVFSDHGEEFWEHGGFEHGHAFHDEVLRVPLVVRSPGLPAGRIDAPVSLLDLTPTILDLVGAPLDTQGRSLAELVTEPGLAEAFEARPQAFGRPLYDGDGWGVLAGGSKWWSRHGKTIRYDLTADPGETTDVIAERDDARLASELGDALDRQVDQVWRFAIEAVKPWPHDVRITVSHPGGIAGADLAYAPRAEDPIDPPVVLGDTQIELQIPAGATPPEALYVRPAGSAEQIRGLGLSLVGKDLVHAAEVRFDLRRRPPGERQQFLRIGKPSFQVAADLAWVPVPEGRAVEGFDSDVKAQLRELGYVGD